VVETFLQAGGTKSSRWKRPSNLEQQNHRSGNLPPRWRNKIITVETFLHAGGTKSSRWKPSSTLEEQNHRSGNLPPRWRNKIIVVETSLQAGGTKSSRWKPSSRLEEGKNPFLNAPPALILKKERSYKYVPNLVKADCYSHSLLRERAEDNPRVKHLKQKRGYIEGSRNSIHNP